MVDPTAIPHSQECTVCLEIVTKQEYFSLCCHSCLCRECFGQVNLVNQLLAATQSLPTCHRCGFVIEPIDATAAITSLITAATETLKTKVLADLQAVKSNIELSRANVTAVVDNLAELKAEITANSLGINQTQVSAHELADLTQQLELFGSSQLKQYQLVLERLFSQQKLLHSRLQGLSELNSVDIFTLSKPWGRDQPLQDQTYKRHVWWRRSSRIPTPWKLTAVDDSRPKVQELFIPGGADTFFFTRLFNDSLAVVRVTTDENVITARAFAVFKAGQNWACGHDCDHTGEYDVVLEVPKPRTHDPAGFCMGALRPSQAGYYLLYSTEKIVDSIKSIVLVIHDFAYSGPTAKTLTRVKSYNVTLPSSLKVRPNQIWRYGDNLFVIVTGRLVTIRLAAGPNGNHIIALSNITDLTIARSEQDYLFLNHNNEEVWQCSAADLINGLTETVPLIKRPYSGPLDRNGYLEIVAPGVIVYCHYSAQIITAYDNNQGGHQRCYQGGFRALAIADDGVIVILKARTQA